MIRNKIRFIAGMMLFVFCTMLLSPAHACVPGFQSDIVKITTICDGCNDLEHEDNSANHNCSDCYTCSCHLNVYLHNIDNSYSVSLSSNSRFALPDQKPLLAFIDKLQRPPRSHLL